MSLQNELDGNNHVGSTILAPNNANNSQLTNETANLNKSNDENFTQNHTLEPSTDGEKINAIECKQSKPNTISNDDRDRDQDQVRDSVSTVDTVIRSKTVEQSDCTTSACDKQIRVKCDDDDDVDNDIVDVSANSSSSNSPSTSDIVLQIATKQHISKPNLANLHACSGRLNAPQSTVIPLSSPPNVPMFVNRFPNTHRTYLPPHIRNLPKTQSLDLADNEMPSSLLTNKQTSFEQTRPIYPNVPYSPYGSPFGSPRNRRRGPLRESRRISIEQTGSFLQLNQYKLMDSIGQVSEINQFIFFQQNIIFS